MHILIIGWVLYHIAMLKGSDLLWQPVLQVSLDGRLLKLSVVLDMSYPVLFVARSRRRNFKLLKVSRYIPLFGAIVVTDTPHCTPVHPILGDASDPSTWISHVNAVDVVIECIGGPQTKTLGEIIFDAVTTAAKQRSTTIPKLTYIYTSGAWVHGDNRSAIASDTSLLGDPPALVVWRQEFEQRIIKSSTLNGIVVRPGVLYGYTGSITSMMFAKAVTGKVDWYGKPGGRAGFIHADDLADLYLKIAEKALLVGGLAFDAANDQTEGIDEVFTRMFGVIGVKGEVNYVEPSNRAYISSPYGKQELS